MRKDDLTEKSFNRRNVLISLIFFSLLMIMTTQVALAHKVIIFAYVEGDKVYTESYFSNGTKVNGGLVEVYDSQGNKLLEGKTDKDGQFNFKPPKQDDLKIILNASMGHRNSCVLSADELPDIVVAQKQQELEPKESEVKEIAQVDLDQFKRIVDGSLDEKLKPVIRQLRKLEQKEISLTEVIGGIGYIFGIMGIILYFVSRKKKVN